MLATLAKFETRILGDDVVVTEFRCGREWIELFFELDGLPERYGVRLDSRQILDPDVFVFAGDGGPRQARAADVEDLAYDLALIVSEPFLPKETYRLEGDETVWRHTSPPGA